MPKYLLPGNDGATDSIRLLEREIQMVPGRERGEPVEIKGLAGIICAGYVSCSIDGHEASLTSQSRGPKYLVRIVSNGFAPWQELRGGQTVQHAHPPDRPV